MEEKLANIEETLKLARADHAEANRLAKLISNVGILASEQAFGAKSPH
jgi:hypothetical protein